MSIQKVINIYCSVFELNRSFFRNLNNILDRLIIRMGETLILRFHYYIYIIEVDYYLAIFFTTLHISRYYILRAYFCDMLKFY